MSPNHLVLFHPFLLLASIFLSIKVFFNELVLLHQVAKVLELQHQSFSEYSVLISFRIDWFSIPAVQRTLKSLLHHNSKASVLQHSTFFMVQLSRPYMTIGKTFALPIQTFVGEVMSLLFKYTVWVSHSFPSKEQASFNFMTVITICGDSGAQENKICHSFQFCPFCLM